jgi:acetyltransferase-like isoleucine patch superfamily enzyme
MIQTAKYHLISAPRAGVNDDVVRLVSWLVKEGEQVAPMTPIAVLETTKATFDIDAGSAGFLFHLEREGAEIPVGSPLAVVSELSQRPEVAKFEQRAPNTGNGGPLISKKARVLLERHGLDASDFHGHAVVRAEDVETLARQRGLLASDDRVRAFRGAVLDQNSDWDKVLGTTSYQELKELLSALRMRMKARFDRHVPTGSLLHDRWELAKDHGFGDGTSVYDECLIMGDVEVGRNCWIGPYTILDGLRAKLTIGDFVDVGAGTHIYTHNTIERALTGHKAPVFARPTTIGNCCFIAPQVLISPGTSIGDHSFIAAGSYLEGVFPPFSYISGNPAKVVGRVEVNGTRARVKHQANPPESRD